MSDQIPEDILDKISFHMEEIDFELTNADSIASWLGLVFEKEEKKLNTLSIILCSDDYLHNLNVEYLQHDTLTDVITFPYSRSAEPIVGDIFISIDRIKENAEKFKITFRDELHRVMVHGVLHLAGYGDKTPEDATIIRAKEDFYLTQFLS